MKRKILLRTMSMCPLCFAIAGTIAWNNKVSSHADAGPVSFIVFGALIVFSIFWTLGDE